MDNIIDKRIQMDSRMKEFFECIGGDADTQQQRIQCIRNGLAAVADMLRLGKAEITVDIPKNRFMPLGERNSAVLYEEEVRKLFADISVQKEDNNIYLSGGKAAQSAAQKEFAEEIRRLLEEQSERQEALLEEMNKNMKNISKNQKGKFSLFK